MKDTFPTLLKFVGALAVTAAIFFALQPDDKLKDDVVNRSMEFLGTKLLAMVPEEQQHHVQQEFDDFSQQARDGKVSNEHVKDVTVRILNAQAEGNKLNTAQVDSILASIREAEIAKTEAAVEKEENEVKRREELIAFSESVQDFAKFEKEWQRMVPLPPPADSTLPPPPRRPLYRVNHNFVVEIDTAAIAAFAVEHAEAFAANAPRAIVVHPAEVKHSLRALSRELPRLKIEMRRMQMHLQIADSVQKAIASNPELHSWTMAWSTQMSDSLKRSFKEMRQQEIQRARWHRRMADSTRRAAEAYERAFRYSTPPPPPKTWTTPKPEKPKPPE
jgi:hypothetical protein